MTISAMGDDCRNAFAAATRILRYGIFLSGYRLMRNFAPDGR